MKNQHEGPVHNRRAAQTLRMIRQRRIHIQHDHHEFLRNLPGGGRNQRLIQEVPIEVVLSSNEEDDPPHSDVHPDPAEEPKSDCSLLNSTISKKEAPEARNNPPKAAPLG